MQSAKKGVEELVDEYVANRIDRRQFIRRVVALGLSAPAAGALLAACGGGSGATGTAGGTGSKTLTLRLINDIANVDPANWVAAVDEEVISCVYEGLVTYKPGTFEMVNQLAESFQPSKDGLSYDFTLKKGIQFHGGYGEATSEDVKFSYERIAGLTKPKVEAAYAGDWAALKEVKVKDRYSGTIILKKPFAALTTSTLPVSSGVVVSKKAAEKLGKKFSTHPVGTGPYEFVSWQPKQQVTLRRFKGYKTGFTDPQFEQLVLKPIQKDSTSDIALQTHEVDFAQLALDSIDRFQHASGFSVDGKTTLDYNFIGMNTKSPKLSDINVRKAIRAAIDVPAILQAAFEGKYTRATGVIPPNMGIGYWKDAPVYKRDVPAAKALLAQASNPPTQLTLTYTEEAGSDAVFEIAQANLADIGIKVTPQKEESATFYQLGKSLRRRELYYVGYVSQPDPSWSMAWFVCDQFDEWNWQYSCDHRFDQLQAEALQQLDRAQRTQMYVEMQQRWDQRADTVWIAWPKLWYAWRSDIKPMLTPHGRVLPAHFTRVSA